MSPDEKQKDVNCSARERYWSELGIEEKLERMRMIVRSERQQIESLNRSLLGLEEFVKNHQHAESGELLLRVKKVSGSIEYTIGKPENLNEVYF